MYLIRYLYSTQIAQRNDSKHASLFVVSQMDSIQANGRMSATAQQHSNAYPVAVLVLEGEAIGVRLKDIAVVVIGAL